MHSTAPITARLTITIINDTKTLPPCRKFRSVICCKKGVAAGEDDEEKKDGDETNTAPRNSNRLLLKPVASSSEEPSPMKSNRDVSLESESSRQRVYLKSSSLKRNLPETPEIAEVRPND